MNQKLARRDFLGALGALAPVAQGVLKAQSADAASGTTPYRKVVLQPFDYSGVSLRSSLLQAHEAAVGRPSHFPDRQRAGSAAAQRLRPFYSFNELERYRMYFDSASRRVLW